MTLRFDRSDGGLARFTAAALKGGVGARDFDGGVKSVWFDDVICAGDVDASADDFESGAFAVGGEDGAAGLNSMPKFLVLVRCHSDASVGFFPILLSETFSESLSP